LNQYAQEQQQAENASNNNGNAGSKHFGTVKDKSSGRKALGALAGRDSTSSKGPPAPSVTKALLNALSNEQTMCKVPVTDVKAVELARQITIMVGKLYADIPYLELLNKDKPNCSRMIQVSNKVYVSSFLLQSYTVCNVDMSREVNTLHGYLTRLSAVRVFKLDYRVVD